MAFTKEEAVAAAKKSSRKGIPNKNTEEIRERLKDLFDDNFEQLKKDIRQMEGKDRAKTMLELAKFVLPTLKAVDHTTEGNEINKTVIVEINTKKDEN